MYYIYGVSVPSLLIESTDSMITIIQNSMIAFGRCIKQDIIVYNNLIWVISVALLVASGHMICAHDESTKGCMIRNHVIMIVSVVLIDKHNGPVQLIRIHPC